MSVAHERHGAIRPPRHLARPTVPSVSAGWLLVLGRAMVLSIGVLAAVGIILGMMRTNLVLILVSWSLLSIAATAVFALSRGAGRR